MDGTIAEDGSLGPESFTLGLTGEGSSDLLQMLSNENKMLKEDLAESSSAMRLACEKLAAANDQLLKERQVFEEKCREAKDVVLRLRDEVQQKNDLLESMKLQAVQDVNYDGMNSEPDKCQLVVLKKSLESATQERDELKNKFVALQMQFESEVADGEELRKQDRQTIELLRNNIENLQKVQTKERNEKQVQSDTLDHVRGSFDELVLLYETLIYDEKKNKAALATKDGQIQHQQLFIHQLERNISALQTQVHMCRSDFEGERKAREFLHNQYMALKVTLEKLTMPSDGQRLPPSGPSSLNSARPKNEICVCPKCGHKAQNIETLYLHSKTCMA